MFFLSSLAMTSLMFPKALSSLHFDNKMINRWPMLWFLAQFILLHITYFCKSFNLFRILSYSKCVNNVTGAWSQWICKIRTYVLVNPNWQRRGRTQSKWNLSTACLLFPPDQSVTSQQCVDKKLFCIFCFASCPSSIAGIFCIFCTTAQIWPLALCTSAGSVNFS